MPSPAQDRAQGGSTDRCTSSCAPGGRCSRRPRPACRLASAAVAAAMAVAATVVAARVAAEMVKRAVAPKVLQKAAVAAVATVAMVAEEVTRVAVVGATATAVAATVPEAEVAADPVEAEHTEARLALFSVLPAKLLPRQCQARRECRPSRVRPKRDPPWCNRGPPGRCTLRKVAGSTRSTTSGASRWLAHLVLPPCSDLVFAFAAVLLGGPCAPCGLAGRRRHRRRRCIERRRGRLASAAAFECASSAWALGSDHCRARRRPLERAWE